MLSALVEHRHNYVDSSCLTADSADYALEISIVIVGAHGNGLTVHFVGNAVVENVANDEDIVSANGRVKIALAFACAESGAMCVYNERLVGSSPFLKIVVDSLCEFLTAAHADDAEVAEKFRFHVSVPILSYGSIVIPFILTLYSNIFFGFCEHLNAIFLIFVIKLSFVTKNDG